MSKKSTKEEFTNKSNVIHKFKYDYSLVEYVNNKSKVNIICKEHGNFEQRPDMHIKGNGCPSCSNNIKKTNTDFIKECKLVHNNLYDYSLVYYKNRNSKIEIICKEHGIFEQLASNHLRGIGCAKCKSTYKITLNDFLKKCKEIHNDKYDYKFVEYINSHTKIKILCSKHGEFEQKPYKHINGEQGCPKCRLSKGILKICKILNDNSIEYEIEKTIKGCVSKNNISLRFDIHLTKSNIYIEYDGEQHFRVVKNWGNINGFNDVKERDMIKNKFCINNNIKLFRISYKDDIIKLTNDIIKKNPLIT